VAEVFAEQFHPLHYVCVLAVWRQGPLYARALTLIRAQSEFTDLSAHTDVPSFLIRTAHLTEQTHLSLWPFFLLPFSLSLIMQMATSGAAAAATGRQISARFFFPFAKEERRGRDTRALALARTTGQRSVAGRDGTHWPTDINDTLPYAACIWVHFRTWHR